MLLIESESLATAVTSVGFDVIPSINVGIQSSPDYTIGTDTIPAYAGDSVDLDASDWDAIAVVSINGVSIDFSFTDSILTLYGTGLTGTVTITGHQSTATVVNVSPITSVPNLFKQYCVADVSFTKQWRGHPSGSFTVIIPTIQKITTLAQFAINGELELYGVGYRIADVTAIDYPRQGKTEITVSLIGKWDSWQTAKGLDTPILLKDLKPSYTLSNIVSRSGGILSGESITIPVMADVSPQDFTTARDALETYSKLYGYFIDWHNPSIIRLKDWKTTSVYTLSKANVLSDSIEYSYQGKGTYYNGVRLAREVVNAKLEIEQTQKTESEGLIITVEGDVNPETLPTISKGFYAENLPVDYLKSPANCFDTGGMTKTKKTTHTYNGTVVKEIEEVWGFVFTSEDVYNISTYLDGNGNTQSKLTFNTTVSLSDYWQLVKLTETVYTFDDDGYNIGHNTTGWEFFRFRQEQDLDVIKLAQEYVTASTARQAVITQLKSLYQFQERAIKYPQMIDLVDMTLYYKDAETVDDVVPKFAIKSYTSEDSLKLTPDPESTETNLLPPIVWGTRRAEESFTSIVIPQSADSIQSPELYRVQTTISTAEGENFNNAIRERSYSDNSGRPSVQERLVIPDDTGALPAPSTTEPNQLYRTSGSHTLDRNIVLETFSYTGGDTIEKVKKAAECEVGWENTENSLTLTLNVLKIPTLLPGDRISFNGRIWTVLSISERHEQRNNNIYCTEFQVSLGLFCPITLEVF